MEGPNSATHAREIARAPKALFEVVVEGMQESSLGRGDGSAWMDNREGKPPCRPKNPLDGVGHPWKIGNIHEREIADNSIEGGVGKIVKMLRITLEIGDT